MTLMYPIRYVGGMIDKRTDEEIEDEANNLRIAELETNVAELRKVVEVLISTVGMLKDNEGIVIELLTRHSKRLDWLEQ